MRAKKFVPGGLNAAERYKYDMRNPYIKTGTSEQLNKGDELQEKRVKLLIDLL